MIKITAEHEVWSRNVEWNLRGSRLFSGKVTDVNTQSSTSFSAGFEGGLQTCLWLSRDVEFLNQETGSRGCTGSS